MMIEGHSTTHAMLDVWCLHRVVHVVYCLPAIFRRAVRLVDISFESYDDHIPVSAAHYRISYGWNGRCLH